MDEVERDKRFSHITSDPRFRKMPQKHRKMKIDHRFQSMFNDKKFKLKYSVDKRGKPVDLTTSENLRRYYELTDSEDSESENDANSELLSPQETVDENLKERKHDFCAPKPGEKQQKLEKEDRCDKPNDNNNSIDVEERKRLEEKQGKRFKKNAANKSMLSHGGKSDSGDTDSEDTGLEDERDDSDTEFSDGDSGPDFARGGGLQETSEEETDSDFSEQESTENNQGIDHKWGELDKDAPEATELGKRLALCNMDWDRIKAADLFILFQSFIKSGGSVHSVKENYVRFWYYQHRSSRILRSLRIYPSEYGRERLKEEAVRGPTEFIKDKVDADDNDLIEDDEGNSYNKEKLRQYQINRLKYYYAVIEVDSVETASHIYDECDGLEYETSSARLDLRFIPDDMVFEQETKDACSEMPDSSLYKPSNFFTTALCQFKVDLTWDETDNDRIQLTTKKFTKDDVREDNFKAFLASSSDEETNYERKFSALGDSDEPEEFDEEKQIEKYKSLIQGINSEEEKKKNDFQMEITWEPGLKETAESLVKQKKKTEISTPWEEYLQKRKEKKIKKRESKKEKEQNTKVKTNKSKTDNDEAAFSDDDLPDDFDPSDPFFHQDDDDDDDDSQTKANTDSKKKKKKLKNKKLTEDEMKKKDREAAELDLLLLDEKDNRKHFNLKDLIEDESVKKKKKKKMKKRKEDIKKTEDDFKIDVGDSRFEAMYTSHLFNVDPSAPEFKNTKGMNAIIDEKLKRRHKKSTENNEELFSKRRKHDPTDMDKKENKRDSSSDLKTVEDTSLSMLVKSVKAKTEKYQMKRKK